MDSSSGRPPGWPAATGGGSLVGRTAELAVLAAAIDAACAGGSSGVLVHGPAGIGKTALVEASLASCDVTVLRVAGAEGAVQPFATLFDVVGPLVPRQNGLDDEQHHVLGAALGLVEPAAPVTEPAVAVAAAAVLADEAARRPVVVVVDDAMWVDAASLHVLLHVAACRLPAVCVLFAARDATGLDLRGLTEIALRGIDAESASALLAAASGVGVPGRVAGQLAAATEGNPLALRELAQLLTPAQLSGAMPIAEPLSAGPSLERHYRDRVRALGPTTGIALAVAAAEPTGATSVVERALGRMGCGLDDLDPAEQDGLVRVGVDVIVFNHPLQRSAAYHTAPLTLRRRAHRALAEEADAAQGPESRAWHLAATATGPDDVIAAELEAAAAHAARRGGHAGAALLARRAADLSASPEVRSRRLMAGSELVFVSGDTDTAEQWLAEARRHALDARTTAEIDRAHAMLLLWRGEVRTAYAVLRAAADRLTSSDPEIAATLLALGVMPLMMLGRVNLACADTAAAVTLAGPQRARTDRDLLVAQAVTALFRGEVETARAHLARYPPARDEIDLLQHGQHHSLLAYCLAQGHDVERAATLQDAVIRTGRRWGAVGVLPFTLAAASELATWQGRWVTAAELASEAIELGERIGHGAGVALATTCAARLHAARGDDERCVELFDGLVHRLGDDAPIVVAVYRTAVLGQLALSRGRTEEAVGLLEETAARTDEEGLELPTVVPWEPDLIEAYVRAGARDRAAERLEILSRRAERCRLAWVSAVTARCAALLSDDLESACAHFAEAEHHHSRTAMPFDRARTALCHGEVLRRAQHRTEARTHLTRALSIFDSLGAAPWRAWAARELEAAGGRGQGTAAPFAELTVQERHVAEAVSRGLSNTAIASSLFVSPKTVESHLTSIYRKLGIRSRTQLVSHLHGTRDGLA